MKDTEIYYFSGTGNSLHVVKELQKRFPGAQAIPIVSLLNQNVIETNGKTVGLVFPLHLTTVPIPVKEFFKKADFTSAEYIFGITTRTGYFSVAELFIHKQLKKQGKRLDSFFILNMGNNSPTGVKPGPGDKDWVHRITPEKTAWLELIVQDELGSIQKAISGREKRLIGKLRNPLFNILEYLITAITKDSKVQLNFYADADCIGCGICENVCPSRKIKMSEGKPEWRAGIPCYYCYACFNFCPAQSVLLKNYTAKNGRYRHPEITADDIAGQKQIG